MKKFLVYIFLVLICLFVYYATLQKQNLGFGFPYFDAYSYIEDSIKLVELNLPGRFSDASYIYTFSAVRLLLNIDYETVHIYLSFFQLIFLSLGLVLSGKNFYQKNRPYYTFLLSFIFFYFSGIIAWRLTPGFRENFYLLYIPVFLFLMRLQKNEKTLFLLSLFYLSSLFSHQLIFYILTPVYLIYIFKGGLFNMKFFWIYFIIGIGFLPLLSNLLSSFFDQMTHGSEMLRLRAWNIKSTLITLDTSMSWATYDVKKMPIPLSLLFISYFRKSIKQKFFIFFACIFYIYMFSFTEKFGLQQNRLSIFILILVCPYLAHGISRNNINRFIFIFLCFFTLTIYTPVLINYKSFFNISDNERAFTKEIISGLKNETIYCSNASCIGIRREMKVQDWNRVKPIEESSELQDIGVYGQNIILYLDDEKRLRNDLIKYNRNHIYIISPTGWVEKFQLNTNNTPQ